MNRFHYTLKQKVQIIDMVETGSIFRTNAEFPRVTQKQLEDWKKHEEEIKAMPEDAQNTKYTLHKGPKRKYSELYQYLYQTVKDRRAERQPVTVESLIQVAEAESDEVATLTYKGKVSLIHRFMELFGLSIREITGTSGYRDEQANEQQIEAKERFIREFKRKIIEKNIPIESIFNMDQTGIFYENPPTRTIDFVGQREIPVLTQGGEKKRLTLFSTISAAGSLKKQLIVMKGKPNARIHVEIRHYNDVHTIHTCQENAWCSKDVLEEWHSKVWAPIAQAIQGPKLLLVDAYPLHVDALALLSKHETTVLLIPSGLTFNLQPLDNGFFKLLKDELRKLWIRDWSTDVLTEQDRRRIISSQVKEVWPIMEKKDLRIFWEKASLTYPYWEMDHRRNLARDMFDNSSLFESRENTQMTIEQDDTRMEEEESEPRSAVQSQNTILHDLGA